MSTWSAWTPNVCLRCQVRSLYPLRPLRRPLHPNYRSQTSRLYATSRSPKSKGQTVESYNTSAVTENTSTRFDRPVTKSWTAFIKTKKLGQSSSVLVLRDSENNPRSRAPRDKPVFQEKLLKDVDISELAASVQAQKSVPGQEEVNQSIDALRPLGVTDTTNARTVIPKSRFDSLARDLEQSFNQQQLSRYIAIKEGNRVLRTEGYTDVTAGDFSFENKSIRRHEWTRSEDKSAQTRKKAILRGKKALVDVLLRSIWFMEIEEEIVSLGSLTMFLHPAQLSLLLIGRTSSALSQLGQRFNVKIDVYKRSHQLRITADKACCEQAADAIESYIGNFIETTADITPFLGAKPRQKRPLDMPAIAAIADGLRCVVHRGNDQKLEIRARDQQHVDQFLRALALASDNPSGAENILINIPPGQAKSVAWSLAQPGLAKDAGMPVKSLGRYTTEAKIAQGNVRVRMPVAENLISPEVFDNAMKHLGGEPKPGLVSPNATTTAIFGHVLFEEQDRATLNERAAPNLPQLLKSQHSLFRTVSIGLPYLLSASFGNAEPRHVNILRVQLLPSPWDPNATSQTLVLPRVSMTFNIDQATRRLTFEKVSLHSSHRQSTILLPGLATDVRMSRQSESTWEQASNDDKLNTFAREVEASAAGYGRITAPSNLPLPTSIVHPESEANEVDYFTVALEFTQELHFDYRGFDFSYSRIGGGETIGKREQIALTDGPGVQSRVASGEATGGEPPPHTDFSLREADFTTTVNDLLEKLNAGAGNLRMMSRRDVIGNRDESLLQQQASA